MPRPTIKQGKTKPTSLPAPKLGKSTPEPRSKEPEVDPDLQKARTAVNLFEQELATLRQMETDWRDNFPDAAEAVDDIKRQRDLVEDKLKKAKPLVAKAKVTVGDFKAQRKYKSAHYDETMITQMLASADDAGEVVEAFLEGGIVMGIALDRDATVAWFAQHPDFAERFNSAWKEEEEMTTAVTVPKI